MYLPLPPKARFIQRVLRRRWLGVPHRFSGDAGEICRQIVEKCWNGTFYQTSLGHFKDFWTRDFAICSGALLHLGFRERTRATWHWALNHFARRGRLTTTIHRSGRIVNFPSESHDALPWLLRALRELGDETLVAAHRPFLQETVARYAESVIDTATGAIRKALIGIRDAVRYRSSAYNVTMLGMLGSDLTALGLKNPFRAFDYRQILLDRYWTGTHFRADAYGDHFSSEANLFPFWTRLVDDRGMWRKVRETIRRLALTKPYPIRYAPEVRVLPVQWYNAFFTPNYQGTTIWTWLGAIYLQLTQRYNGDDTQPERRAFAEMIERHGTFPELLNPDGTWYQTPFYRADEGMLWAALFLDTVH